MKLSSCHCGNPILTYNKTEYGPLYDEALRTARTPGSSRKNRSESLDANDSKGSLMTNLNLPDFSTWSPGLLRSNLAIWQDNRRRADEAIRRIQEILALDDSMRWTVRCLFTGDTMYCADDLTDAQRWLEEEGQYGDYVDADEKPE